MPPPSTNPPPLGRPLFLLNLKVYPECLGPPSERIAHHLEELGLAAGVPVAIAPATPDLARVSASVGIPVLAQHVDASAAGAHTGFVPPEAIRAAGASGSLVNHSEHPLSAALTRRTVARLRATELVSVVCAPTVLAARQLARTQPSYLAIEPPELIGGDRAVSTARPEVVSDTVAAVRSVAPSVAVLCGAGVHDRRDVHRALELGAVGVLVASAVTRARSPRDAIAELLAGF
ncbi:MAG: triose-phosphate isomerase [Thermoplasmata archaeon]|nr:triose-phosphate isomerase [Thermoplasmata archaeon]